MLNVQVPKNQIFWMFRFPDFQVLRFQISRLPDFQVSRFPDFQTPLAPAAPPAPDKLSDPNLTPLPTHPGIKYIATRWGLLRAMLFLAASQQARTWWCFMQPCTVPPPVNRFCTCDALNAKVNWCHEGC